MTQIATWQLPSGVSADSSKMIVERMKHYRFVLKHYLNDGTRIAPTISTMRHIIQAYDEFGIEVAISSKSFSVLKE